MKVFKYTVQDMLGIHARPAGMLVKESSKYVSNITIEKEGREVNAKKIMAVMSLGVKQGQEVTVKIDGADEAQASMVLVNFFRDNL